MAAELNRLSRFFIDDFASGYMDAWKTLRQVIPQGGVKSFAMRMHVSSDYVRRWRREPLSDEAPFATGQVSPLSRFCQLLDVALLENPAESALIIEHANLHWEILTRAHGISEFNSCDERHLTGADLLVKSIEAINSLNVDGVTDHTLRHLVLLRSAVDSAISRVGIGLKGREVKQ